MVINEIERLRVEARQTTQQLLQSVLEKICETCGKKYERAYNKPHQRFCSSKCKVRHPEKLEYFRRYNKSPKRRQNQQEYQQSPEYREWRRQNGRMLRIKLMKHLGGKLCLDCDCKSFKVLQFDHIDPKDSKEDSQRFQNARLMVRYYLKHLEEAKQKLQVLCRLCNNARNRKYYYEENQGGFN